MPESRNIILRYLLEASDEPFELHQIRSDMNLRDDLDLSSMQAITAIMDLEDEFGITIEDEEIGKLATVEDVLILVQSKRS